MANVDLLTNDYPEYPPPVKGDINSRIISRRITGAELTAAGTPASDTFRIMQLRKGQLVREVKTMVVVVDTTGVTSLDIGYQNISTGAGSATAFDADVDLTTPLKTVISADDSLVMFEDSWLTITPHSAILAGCVFIISALIEDYGLKLRDDTMTAVL